MGLKYNILNTLDITNDTDDIRLVIKNENSIKRFWLKMI